MFAPDVDPKLWRKSARSSANGACVEIAELPDAVAVRDSKNPDGPILWFGTATWREFIMVVRTGAFDGSRQS